MTGKKKGGKEKEERTCNYKMHADKPCDRKVYDDEHCIFHSKDIEGIIIPGGGTRIFKPELKDLILRLNAKKKLLAAICAGPEFLAKSGVLDGRNYTTTKDPQSYEEVNEEDPFPRETYVETRVIRDGNIITAKGYAFSDFALKIWDWFNLYNNEEEKEELKIQYTPA